MRKNMIALMMVLPILFVLVVYGAVNVSGLNVTISANGIEIQERYPNDTISIDLADYSDSYEITPVVQPKNATNAEFDYRYELISGSATPEEVAAGDVVRVEKADVPGRADRIVANGVGTVRIVAVSRDGGYEDSITAIVGSSKPYAMDFELLGDMGATLLEEGSNGYTAHVDTGSYAFKVRLKPNTHISPNINVTNGFAVPDPANGSIRLPFTGDVSFDVTIPNGVKGALTKHVELTVGNPGLTEGGIAVNGDATNNPAVGFDRQSGVAEFYVESAEQPTVSCVDVEGGDITVQRVPQAQNGWKVTARIDNARDGDSFDFSVRAGNVLRSVRVNAVEFDFTIRADIPNFDITNGANILLGTEISFYARPVDVSYGVTYKWDFINVGDEMSLDRTYNDDSERSVCTMTAHARDKFIVVVEAWRNGSPIANIDAKELEIEVINNVVGATGPDTNLGLAKSLAVPGHRYSNGAKADNIFAVPINAHSPAGALQDGVMDFDYTLSDNSLARIVTDESGQVKTDEATNSVFLEVLGKGNLVLTAAWKGNADWREEDPYELHIPLTVDADAVEVTTYSQLLAETDAGNPVVLGADIMLGTYDNGEVMPLEVRRGLLKTMRSTFNTEYYNDLGMQDDAVVHYVVEFKNDVYGNGHSVNGEYFAHAVDSTGSNPQLFKGPLYLVSLGDMASVAAQDNIVFLCRTDGVTIHNATLLGCNDSSLTDPQTGMTDLTGLEYAGTVLEINADVNLLNCRVRNGRNVVRVYGGNRSADRYFVDSLSQSTVSSADRAVVRIEGCVLSHSREFVLKLGANRALRSGTGADREPYFTDRNGNRYTKTQTNDYLNDSYFYQTYVLTDLTVADTVLEKSGLFCIGVETNFAGEMLCPDSRFADGEFRDALRGWLHVGGTSFASVLRLQGNVRMYDWKDIANINSDTLINTNGVSLPIKLDLAAMIDFMSGKRPDEIGPIVDEEGGSKYVHGGIALYGGGRNYSQVDLSQFDADRISGLQQFNINIAELRDDEEAEGVGQYLPYAAGTQDFRFYMYNRNGSNNRAWQAAADYNVSAVPFE